MTIRKQRQIARLAELWMCSRPWALVGVGEVRFDVVAIDATHRAAAPHASACRVLTGWASACLCVMP